MACKKRNVAVGSAVTDGRPKSACRGQSSMEFIGVYGWAILVFLVAVSFLFWSGVFSGPPTTAPVCVLPGDLSCVSYAINYQSGGLILDLANNKPDAISVTAIRCTDDANPVFNVTDNLGVPITIRTGEHAVVSAADHYCYKNANGAATIATGDLGALYRGRIYIRYIELESGVTRIATGDLALKLENASVTTGGPFLITQQMLPYTATVPGLYVLASSLTCTLADNGLACINFTSTATGAVLDCQGNMLGSSCCVIIGCQCGNGVSVYANNVTIKNCIISGVSGGIQLWSSNYSTIRNNSLTGVSTGISLVTTSSFNTIVNNTSSNNPGFGISVGTHSTNNTVRFNTCNNVDRGFVSWDSLNNLVDNNFFNSSVDPTILMDGNASHPSNATVTNNYACTQINCYSGNNATGSNNTCNANGCGFGCTYGC